MRFKMYLISIKVPQKLLVGVLGITKGNISHKVNGRSPWTTDELYKIKQHFQMPDDLFVYLFFKGACPTWYEPNR